MEPRPGESEYPLFMPWFTSEPAWDIAVAPLEATPFNACKSDIKFLDYCALGAAGIYSDVPAYAGSVGHRVTGWLVTNTVEDWIAALDTLISDEERRIHIANAGRRYLYAQRLVAHSVTGMDRGHADRTR